VAVFSQRENVWIATPIRRASSVEESPRHLRRNRIIPEAAAQRGLPML